MNWLKRLWKLITGDDQKWVGGEIKRIGVFGQDGEIYWFLREDKPNETGELK